MDIERAKAIAGVAQVIIDSAKAETQFLQVTGATSGSGFMPEEQQVPAAPQLTAVAGGRGR